MRLFVFGCSFTKYKWPTWADIVAKAIKPNEYYNYGGQGLGNYAIECLLLEADLRHKFTEKDIILVNWSGWNREDKYLPPKGWRQGRGSVLHLHHYDEDYLKKHWSEENDIIRSATSIISCNRLYNISFQTSVVPIGVRERGMKFSAKEDIFDFYFSHLPEMVDWFHYFDNSDICFFNNWLGLDRITPVKNRGTPFRDPHPDILEHMEWAKDVVLPNLGFYNWDNRITTWCNRAQKAYIKYYNKNLIIEGFDFPGWEKGDDPFRL